MYIRFGKRLYDILLALLVLIILSPIVIAISILIFSSMGRPIMFKQLRIGKDESPFEIMKFRSMKTVFQNDGKPESDELRITRIGKFIRKTSLDEIPSLLNVIKGDLSMVGPRPLLPEYLSLYAPHHLIRHKVRPGVTGLAQVKGRNSISWEKRFDLDAEYTNKISLKLDSLIMLRTVKAVISQEGINEPGQVTQSPFEGY